MIVQCPRCQARHDSQLYRHQDAIQCPCGTRLRIPALPQLAAAWQCPNCGGATSPDNNRCEFCGVYLAFQRCPACFDPVFDGARYCPACGEYLLTPAATNDKDQNTAMPCPRCDDTLHARQAGQHRIHACPGCGGIWLGHPVLRKVLQDKGNDKALNILLGKRHEIDQLPKRHPVAYLPCPQCGELMHRRNFAGRSGVIIDECAAHGLWFDRHELAAAIRFARHSHYTDFSRPTDLDGQREQLARRTPSLPPDPPASDWRNLLDELFSGWWP